MLDECMQPDARRKRTPDLTQWKAYCAPRKPGEFQPVKDRPGNVVADGEWCVAVSNGDCEAAGAPALLALLA
jgi:hypothetical protein